VEVLIEWRGKGGGDVNNTFSVKVLILGRKEGNKERRKEGGRRRKEEKKERRLAILMVLVSLAMHRCDLCTYATPTHTHE
jgi:hypothetical protein